MDKIKELECRIAVLEDNQARTIEFIEYYANLLLKPPLNTNKDNKPIVNVTNYNIDDSTTNEC
jgi:hypothetical protein